MMLHFYVLPQLLSLILEFSLSLLPYLCILSFFHYKWNYHYIFKWMVGNSFVLIEIWISSLLRNYCHNFVSKKRVKKPFFVHETLASIHEGNKWRLINQIINISREYVNVTSTFDKKWFYRPNVWNPKPTVPSYSYKQIHP